MSKNDTASVTNKRVRQRQVKNLKMQGTEQGRPTQAELQGMMDALAKRQTELRRQNEKLHQQRARAEEALQRYRDLYDFSPICFLTLDERGKIIEANLTAAKRLGMAKSSLLGRSFPAFVISADLKVIHQHLKDVFRAPGRHTCEVRIRGKDAVFYVACHSAAISGEGRPLCQTVAIDITQRHTAEEEFRILMESAPLGISIIEPGGRYKYVNTSFTKLFGYTLEDVPTGREWFTKAFPVPEYRSKVIADWKTYLKESKVGEDTLRTFTVTCKDGSEKVINFRAAHLESGDQFILYEDISERRHIEEALKHSEMQYRTLVEQIPAVVFKGYSDWSVDCFDQKVEALTGYTKEDFNSRRIKWSDLIPPEEMAYVKQTFRDALRTDLSYVREHRIRKKNGDYAWVQCRGRIFLDGEGRVDYVSGVTFDITPRKQAEKALKESEARYRLLVEQIPAVVYKGYVDWSIDCFDSKIEDLTGYSLEDFNSRRIRWCDIILEEDLDYVKKIFVDALRTKRSYVREYRIRKKSGELAWVQSRGRIFLDDKGRVDYVSGVVFDVTERKRAEEAIRESEARYRLLAGNVSDVIWIANMDLSPTYVSPSVERLFGYTPQEALALDLADMLTPASQEVARNTLLEGLALEGQGKDPGRTWTKELEFFKKDGSTLWTEVKAAFLRDSQGNPVGILGVTRDISERKLAEKALRRREAVLEAVRFAAEKFLEDASWEANIKEILARLGQAIEASRVYIFENHPGPDGAVLTSQRHEWAAPQIEPQIDNPELQNFAWQTSGFGRWEKALSQGHTIFGHVRDFPAAEESFLTSQDIKSIAVVPIFVNQQWWGFLGFDECLREREWSVAELEALKAAASTIGAAIQHNQADQALKHSQERLRHLSSQLLAAQEVERKRIANELHDELGHALLTIKLHLQSLERQLYPEQGGLKKEMKPMLNYIDQVIGNVRRLYLDLIPGDLEYSGLTGSIRNLIEEFAAHEKRIRWELDLDNIDELFSLPGQIAVFRIFQEALTNIGKHAKPSRVAIAINRKDSKVSCVIEDNGKGFSVDDLFSGPKGKKRLGLVAMEERVKMMGGSFEIWSQKKRGTRIRFTVPSQKRR